MTTCIKRIADGTMELASKNLENVLNFEYLGIRHQPSLFLYGGWYRECST